MAKFGIALGSGPRGLGFKSRHSDHIERQQRILRCCRSVFSFCRAPVPQVPDLLFAGIDRRSDAAPWNRKLRTGQRRRASEEKPPLLRSETARVLLENIRISIYNYRAAPDQRRRLRAARRSACRVTYSRRREARVVPGAAIPLLCLKRRKPETHGNDKEDRT